MKRYLTFSIIAVMFMPLCAHADQDPQTMIDSLDAFFAGIDANEKILQGARDLFRLLATISLVWTMASLILRQDIGEVLMELLRFIVVTGTFYWLLDNASSMGGGDDFIDKIVSTFHELGGSEKKVIVYEGNAMIRLGLESFFDIVDKTENAKVAEGVVLGVAGILILLSTVLVAAQIVLAITMAWFLGYGGLFLLGFGGARWTSQIAVNFYKHVLAVGIVIMALHTIAKAGKDFLIPIQESLSREVSILHVGIMLVGSLLMAVLAARIPQMLYTLVTGSTLGFYAGSAGMAGTAIATGGGAAMAYATGGGFPGSGAPPRDSAVDAVRRAPLTGSAGDTFTSLGDPVTGPHAPQGGSGTVRSSVFSAAASTVHGVSPSGTATASASGLGAAQAPRASQARDVSVAAGIQTVERSPAATPVAAGPAASGDVADTAVDESYTTAARPDYDAEMSAVVEQRSARQVVGDSPASRGANVDRTPTPLAPDVVAATHEEGIHTATSEVTSTTTVDASLAMDASTSHIDTTGIATTTSTQAVTSTIRTDHDAVAPLATSADILSVSTTMTAGVDNPVVGAHASAQPVASSLSDGTVDMAAAGVASAVSPPVESGDSTALQAAEAAAPIAGLSSTPSDRAVAPTNPHVDTRTSSMVQHANRDLGTTPAIIDDRVVDNASLRAAPDGYARTVSPVANRASEVLPTMPGKDMPASDMLAADMPGMDVQDSDVSRAQVHNVVMDAPGAASTDSPA